jgi:hypothetical protein
MSEIGAVDKHLATLNEYDQGDSPGVVWYLPLSSHPPKQWMKLSGHACNGFSIDSIDGWVLPVQMSTVAESILSVIANEKFLSKCDVQNLDYETNDQHREAYKVFLASNRMQEGDMDMFQQAVYPLAPTLGNLMALGCSSLEIPTGAKLLVLGWNCD